LPVLWRELARVTMTTDPLALTRQVTSLGSTTEKAAALPLQPPPPPPILPPQDTPQHTILILEQ
jgi:hypothetical protein